MLLSSMAGVNGNGHGLGGESFLDNPATVQTLEQLAHSSAPIGSIMLGQWMSAEAFADSLGRRPRARVDDQPGLEGYRKERWPQIVRQPYRPLSLLELIPTGTMQGSGIEYVVELGDLDDAAETGEGQIKPEGDITFEEAEAPARTIAVWIKQRRQVLADVPELQAVLSSRLTYKVQRRIEQQILSATASDKTCSACSTRPASAAFPTTPPSR